MFMYNTDQIYKANEKTLIPTKIEEAQNIGDRTNWIVVSE